MNENAALIYQDFADITALDTTSLRYRYADLAVLDTAYQEHLETP